MYALTENIYALTSMTSVKCAGMRACMHFDVPCAACNAATVTVTRDADNAITSKHLDAATDLEWVPCSKHEYNIAFGTLWC